MLWSSPAAPAYTLGPICGQKTVTSPTGVVVLILFANNGAVQRYQLVAGGDNVEHANDATSALENTYGPAAVNAPPLRIVSFKASEGGMQVPDKAIDSCGRTLDFN
ncbi:MAG TPA: hypothetical protein VMF61_14175 [Candidatus Acidoferrales bacterium]|nr:hypothetical protein [Candidatus Acidoferrales bacterium]